MASADNSGEETASQILKNRPFKPRMPSEFYRRVPPFSVQRLLKAMAEPGTSTTNQQQVSIKQDNSVDLERLSINELNELLKKQDKLVSNKQLLSKLKDKGEKIISFRNKIAATIKLKEEVKNAEVMLEKLSLNSKESSETVHHRIKIIENAPTSTAPRFNIHPKPESTVKVTDLKSRDFKEVKVKIEMPKEIKTLDFQDSLKTLEEANQRNMSAMADQILRFKASRIPDSSDESDGYEEEEEEEEGEEEENDYEDDDGPHVTHTIRLT
ncbi:putative GRINL1B complex locus protein 2 [Tyrophagus putrescentiae]|nr:putative GRINL1B complex locus protein 2 [Tyrophagus putrescentiae]